MKNINLIFDFDSTLLRLETIEVLADFALKGNSQKEMILDEIKKTTSLAMSGKILFSVALKRRISLLNINKTHVKETAQFLETKLSKSFHENIHLFKKNINNCFVISGGFKDIIIPILNNYGFNKNNIYANSFIYDEKWNAIIDEENDLSKDGGKQLAAIKIPGYKIIIGDGYTDYELKKSGAAKKFILYTENIFRKELKNKADFITNNFNDVFKYANNEK